MARKSGPIRIISDGTGPGTVVTDGQGTIIENVGAVTLWMAAGELNHADITVFDVSIDVKAEVGDIEMVCPICEHTEKHKCTPQNLGGEK